MSGCAAEMPGGADEPLPEPPRGYRCEEGFRFVIQPAGDLVRLTTPEEEAINLTRTESASGKRYADDRAVFRRQGRQVLLEIDGQVYRDCKPLTSDEPYEFSASGFEPGWTLAIDHQDRMVFVGDYGDFEITAPTPEPEWEKDARALVYRTKVGDDELTVSVRDEVCYEASGYPAPSTVTVRLNDREYGGCGTDRPEWPEK